MRAPVRAFGARTLAALAPLSALLLAAATTTSCSSSEETQAASVLLLVGDESGAWTDDPAPKRVELRLLGATEWTVLGDAPAPASVVPLRNIKLNPGIYQFEAVGLDSDDNAVLRGISMPYIVREVDAFSLPMFLGRVGQWSRPTYRMQQPRRNAPVALLADRYLIAAGGEALNDSDPAKLEVFDFGLWERVALNDTMPRLPKSLVAFGNTLVLLVNGEGATWVDLGYTPPLKEEPATPSGFSWDEVAGGTPLQGLDGSSYLVGATRTTGKPTASILKVRAADRELEVIKLATPRLGATATMMGDKLIVAGGSAEGAGLEVLESGKSVPVPLGYPADPMTQQAIAPFDVKTVVLLGGNMPKDSGSSTEEANNRPRLVRTDCKTDCETLELPITLPRFASAQAFPLAVGRTLVVATKEDGENVAYELTDEPSFTAVPLREPRKGASVLGLADGQVAIVGGERVEDKESAHSLEVFIPR